MESLSQQGEAQDSPWKPFPGEQAEGRWPASSPDGVSGRRPGCDSQIEASRRASQSLSPAPQAPRSPCAVQGRGQASGRGTSPLPCRAPGGILGRSSHSQAGPLVSRACPRLALWHLGLFVQVQGLRLGRRGGGRAVWLGAGLRTAACSPVPCAPPGGATLPTVLCMSELPARRLGLERGSLRPLRALPRREAVCASLGGHLRSPCGLGALQRARGVPGRRWAGPADLSWRNPAHHLRPCPRRKPLMGLGAPGAPQRAEEGRALTHTAVSTGAGL